VSATIADGIWPLLDASGMQALDRNTIEALGVPGEILMESAGRAVVERVLARRAHCGAASGEVRIVCGVGNNGGDGLVVARHLQLLGVPVRIALVGDAARLSGDAAANWKRAAAVGTPLAGDDWGDGRGGIVVDALFGTGLRRAVEGEYAEAIARMNAARAAGAWLIAVDLPSGLDSDRGIALGAVVRADETVTIGLPKLGLALEPGRSFAGAIRVARIGIADEAPGVDAKAELWTPRAAGRLLPDRGAADHKGSFGHVLIVAGSVGKTGAASLASLGAARVGAGLVTLACPAALNPILEVKTTEAMTVPVADAPDGGFAVAAGGEIIALARERDVVALGPGVGRGKETAELMRELAKQLEGPLVIDADGLNALADEPGSLAALKARAGETILTPHPGEAARLLECGTAEINADRVAAARELAQRSGSVALLKGAGTVVADTEGCIYVNATGGPALSSGGTGDVLTGLVSGLLAQGLPARTAASLAAYVHGYAADRIAEISGSSGLLAGDLARAVPDACRALRNAGATEGGSSGGEESRLLLPFPGA
jgi:hydroxyethylthiazole kinase-like uncharacterized protein yjeF